MQQYKHLEEPWRALHAATVIALDEARRHTRSPACSKQKMHKALLDEANQPRPWSTARIVGKIVREYDKIARHMADQLQLQQLQGSVGVLCRPSQLAQPTDR